METTLDHLAGSWRIYQLKRGHRFSVDDTLTAWTAAAARPQAERVLDLGCGIGSVGLLTLWRLPVTSTLVGVEAQEVSLELARQTTRHNQLENRVRLLLSDLREDAAFRDLGQFPLITGSPPYQPPAQGVLSPFSQRAACRFELRGDVFDYCRRAAAQLAPGGCFVFVHLAADPRPEQAIKAAGLCLLERREVIFRSHLSPLIALFTCAHAGRRADAPPFVVRDAQGRWSDAYLRMRREMGTVVWNIGRSPAGAVDEDLANLQQ